MIQIIRLAMLGLAGTLIAVMFRSHKSEYGVYIGCATGILLFAFSLGQVSVLLDRFAVIKEYLQGSEQYLAVLLKVIGITYVCELSAGICKDAGYGSIAEQIEILGKLSVMFAGFPILFAVLEQLGSFF